MSAEQNKEHSLAEVFEKISRLEAVMQYRLDAIIYRLDKLNGTVARHEEWQKEHTNLHNQENVTNATMREKLKNYIESQESIANNARWQIGIYVMIFLSLLNILIQVTVRIFFR